MPPQTPIARSNTSCSFHISRGNTAIRLTYHRDQSCMGYALRRFRSGALAHDLVASGLCERVAELLKGTDGPGMTVDGLRFWLCSTEEDTPDGPPRTLVMGQAGSQRFGVDRHRQGSSRLLQRFATDIPYCTDWPYDVLDAMGPNVDNTWPNHATICWDLPKIENTNFHLGGWFDIQARMSATEAACAYWSLFSSTCRYNVVGAVHSALRDSPGEGTAKALMEQFVLRSPTFVLPDIIGWDADREIVTYRFACFTTPNGAALGWVGPMLFNAWNRVFNPRKKAAARHNHNILALKAVSATSLGLDFDFVNISQRLLSYALPSRVDPLAASTQAA